MVSALGLLVLAVCSHVAGAAAILRPGTVVLLGEIHGTREAPDAVSSLACLAVDEGRPLTVALEIPRSEQGRLDAYFAGGSEDELLGGEFWRREYQDGRSSEAMLRLLSSLRSFGDRGQLRVLAIDDPRASGGRDEAMARRLEAVSTEAPEELILVLTGNVHNRLSRGVSWDPDYQPMGYRLRHSRLEAELVALEMTHAGGSAWVCTGETPDDCGARELRGREAAPPGITLLEDSKDAPFTGRFQLGTISASPPAR